MNLNNNTNKMNSNRMKINHKKNKTIIMNTELQKRQILTYYKRESNKSMIKMNNLLKLLILNKKIHIKLKL